MLLKSLFKFRYQGILSYMNYFFNLYSATSRKFTFWIYRNKALVIVDWSNSFY